MERNASSIGFSPLPEKDEIVNALLNDPPDIRWRMIRELYHIREPDDRKDLIETLRPHLFNTEDFKIKYRLTLALHALHNPLQVDDYVLVKGKGAFKPSELESGDVQGDLALRSEQGNISGQPVADFHIHPKSPDLKFFSDMKEAGITHGVILATDTDPEDADRPEIQEQLRKAYSKTPHSSRVPFENILKHIRASLYSPTHVTNQDVADWVNDYPNLLTGFGSVNLCKDSAYVAQKLEEIESLNLKGIKLLPYSQFFNPAENENMDMLFEYCRRTGSAILSHSGCAAGPFEIVELSQNSHPDLWEPLLKKYPDVRVVLAHFGAYSTNIPGIWFYETLQLGKKYENLYADLAAVDWILNREIAVKEIRDTIGFDRVLFGTDYPMPLASGLNLTYFVKSIKANMYLTETEKQKILGENCIEVLGVKC